MLGAIVGDIVGSVYEFNNHRSKDFQLFKKMCFFTDDTVMTLALCKAFLRSKEDFSDLGANAVKYMREVGQPYEDAGYGDRFFHWMYSDAPKPYNSFGNGAAMRVSSAAWVAKSLDEAKKLSKIVTEVTHNHPEGIKGAEATTVAIYMALHGASKENIKAYMEEHYYKIDFTLDEIRKTYAFNETCQETVPQALEAFFESKDFEDAIRNAISIGGDSDTLAAITGSVAEAYYGVPFDFMAEAIDFLDDNLIEILDEFHKKYGNKFDQ